MKNSFVGINVGDNVNGLPKGRETEKKASGKKGEKKIHRALRIIFI